MLKVLFLSRGDWAGTGYFTMSAINSIGRIQCRQLTFYPHIYKYPTDILIPKCFLAEPVSYPPEVEAEARRILDEADLIHIFNDEIPSFEGVIDFDTSKVKSYTFSGSYYRDRPGHAIVNARMKELGARLVVQNPTYFWPEETVGLHVEYIPHAIDLERFNPCLPKEEGNIGCYDPAHSSTTARIDIALMETLLMQEFPDWKLVCKERTTWEERLKKLAHCALYFEYMDPNLGYFGQSALEACGFGIPVMSYISEKALKNGGERLGKPAIVHVTPETLEEDIRKLIENKDYRMHVSVASRFWIENHFSYPVVGELYTKFFEELA